MAVILILILPFALAGFWLKLFITKQHKGLMTSGLSFLTMAVLGFWTVFQSRSSTAAIGLVFLPSFSVLCGLLAWLFARFKNHSQLSYRFFAWIMLIVNLAVFCLWIKDAYLQRVKNNERDQANAVRETKIKDNRKLIKEKLVENQTHQAEWLNDEIQNRETDELFLIPALEYDFVKPEILEKLSHSEISSVVHMVTRNPQTSSTTLRGIYVTSGGNGFYNQALAANKTTPVDVLRQLYENSQPHLPMDKWLAENPSTPKDILLKISESKDVLVLNSLMKNTAVDCQITRLVLASLSQSGLVDTYKYLNQVRILAHDFQAQRCK